VVDAGVDPELLVASAVEQERQALAGGELARRVLAGDALLPAAERRRGPAGGELLHERAQQRGRRVRRGGHQA
jgi:hypothetical protein